VVWSVEHVDGKMIDTHIKPDWSLSELTTRSRSTVDEDMLSIYFHVNF